MVERSVLLPAVRGVDSGEREEVHHPEVAGDPTASRRKRRPPVALREVGISVELQEPDENFADDPAANGPKGQTVRHDLRFSQDVVPERRRLIEVQAQRLELGEVPTREPRNVQLSSNALAGRQQPGNVAQEIALRKRGGRVSRGDRAEGKVEQRGGNPGVDGLVGSHVLTQGAADAARSRLGPEIEEGLPADESPTSSGAAT